MSKPTTTVLISKSYAKDVAEDVIKRMDRNRYRELQNRITERMKVDQRGFWAKLFGKPKQFMTREEALNDIKFTSDGFFSEYDWIMCDGSYYYEAAQDLLRASTNPNIENIIEIEAQLLNTLTR
jgi:hypothetical protein